ncbi:hypothetical protein [Frondihabitans cladoniiphilus]|uniref:PH (Pleckstrin Homology) domain-containing protein n=1 Tax=Frondihabitans cladoniiphilus TaxID=715785 RepID=A0ABP8W0V1_9MICO
METGIGIAEGATSVLPDRGIGRSAIFSAAFSLAPVFGVLLWLTHRSDAWPVVVLAEIVVTAVCAVVFIRFKLVHASVHDGVFVKQGLFGRTRVDRSRIFDLVLTRVYRNNSSEFLTRLLAVDRTGRRLFRLDGIYWPTVGLEELAEALDVDVTIEEETLTRGEYFAVHPTARYWYEKPVVVALAVMAAIVLLIAAVEAVQGLVTV